MNEPDYSAAEADFSSEMEGDWEQGRNRRSALRQGEAVARENLLVTVLGALALGFAIGYFSHRPRPTFQERYLNPRMEDLGDTLRVLAEKTAEQADKGAVIAADLIHTLADKIEYAFRAK